MFPKIWGLFFKLYIIKKVGKLTEYYWKNHTFNILEAKLIFPIFFYFCVFDYLSICSFDILTFDLLFIPSKLVKLTVNYWDYIEGIMTFFCIYNQMEQFLISFHFIVDAGRIKWIIRFFCFALFHWNFSIFHSIVWIIFFN